MAIFVDSSVLLDVFTEDPRWFGWSSTMLAKCASEDTLVLDAIVYAEIAPRFATIEELEEALDPLGYELRPLSREAAFLAAKAFVDYRKHGGPRTRILPDFLIGAHAAVEGLPLLTRDPGRVKTYFPSVQMICP